jgi:hypothetical protein
MLLVPDVAGGAGLVVADAGPVMTSCPGCKPLTTTVLVLSVLPAWIGTRTGAPFCMTKTAVPLPGCVLAYEIAELGTSRALLSCSVMIVTVAVMPGNNGTVVGSAAIRTLYVTTLDVVVPAGMMADTVPLNVWPGYAVNVNVAF